MVHEHTIKRVRGKPFAKGNTPHNKKKSDSKILDDSGFDRSDEGGIVEMEKHNEKLETALNDILETLSEDIVTEYNEKNCKVLEKLTFTSGKNKLEIVLCKNLNRTHKIYFLLNDMLEVKPATYGGATTAKNFWNVLKNMVMK